MKAGNSENMIHRSLYPYGDVLSPSKQNILKSYGGMWLGIQTRRKPAIGKAVIAMKYQQLYQ